MSERSSYLISARVSIINIDFPFGLPRNIATCVSVSDPGGVPDGGDVADRGSVLDRGGVSDHGDVADRGSVSAPADG